METRPFDIALVDEYLAFILADFLRYNPMNVAMNIPPEVSKPVFAGLLKRGCENGLSRALYSENGEIVGLLNCIIRERDEANYCTRYSAETDKQLVLLFSRLQDEKFDTWSRISRELTQMLWVSVISIKHELCGKGLARKMLADMLGDAKKLGLKVVAANAGAIASQNVLCEALHDEILDANGCQILKCQDGTKSNQLLCQTDVIRSYNSSKTKEDDSAVHVLEDNDSDSSISFDELELEERYAGFILF